MKIWTKTNFFMKEKFLTLQACGFHEKNIDKKSSDFDENWYAYRPNF